MGSVRPASRFLVPALMRRHAARFAPIECVGDLQRDKEIGEREEYQKKTPAITLR